MKSAIKSDNIYKIVRAFLKQTRVPVTRTAVRAALGTPDTDVSLATLSDSFSQWKIESVAVRLKPDQLGTIDFPAIAHLTADDGLGYFVVLTDWKAGKVSYFDSELGNRTEEIDSFGQKWAGVTLLAAPDGESGETNFAHNRRQETLTYLRTWLPALIAIFCFSWGISQPMPWSGIVLTVIKAIGIALSISLLWEQYGSPNSLLDKVCQVNAQTDCRAVLNSPAAKLFGWLGMAEIGFVYFTGGLLSIILSAYGHTQPTVLPYLAVLNLLTLPYTVFSIYYQGWVIKKWCPLCVGVQAVLWLEFGAGWLWLQEPYLDMAATAGLLTVCFGIPTALWLITKPLVQLGPQNSTLTKEVARFRENTDLFQALLESEPAHAMQYEQNEITLGNPEAPLTLTMVSGPFCSPCAAAHQTVERLLAEHPNELRIVIRFTADATNGDDQRNQMARYMLALADQKPAQLPDALTYWYQTRKADQLISRFPAHPDASTDALLQRHIQWCSAVNIQFTPTFFLNDRSMPKHFTVADLSYHIRHLAEQRIQPTIL